MALLRNSSRASQWLNIGHVYSRHGVVNHFRFIWSRILYKHALTAISWLLQTDIYLSFLQLICIQCNIQAQSASARHQMDIEGYLIC